jgi:hypothetical protein
VLPTRSRSSSQSRKTVEAVDPRRVEVIRATGIGLPAQVRDLTA